MQDILICKPEDALGATEIPQTSSRAANDRRCDVAVVGAGVTGLTAARALAAAGLAVLVLDKGRGVGGRVATRRIDGATVDHGAQALDAGDSGAWAGLAAGLPAKALVRRSGRWIGCTGMTSLAKSLAAPLEILTAQRVLSVRVDGLGYQLPLESGGNVAARTVVVTAPVPQAMDLLAQGQVPLSAAEHRLLEGIEYDPCLVALAVLEREPLLPDVWIEPGNDTLALIANHQARGVSTIPAVTVHATPAWSTSHWDAPREQSAAALMAAAMPWIDAPVRVLQSHGWRYARPRAPAGIGCLVLEGAPGIVIAGDAFTSGDLGGAFRSGCAAAEAVLQRGV
jgi:predicted NAD/FAD-dependent oxidoreductase